MMLGRRYCTVITRSGCRYVSLLIYWTGTFTVMQYRDDSVKPVVQLFVKLTKYEHVQSQMYCIA